MMKFLKLFIFILALCTFYAPSMQGQWATDLSINNPICTATDYQQDPRVTTDGLGGAIITWYDNRIQGNITDIYAQRISANGNVQWTTNGVPICIQSERQIYPVICSDGKGGAIICWYDSRTPGTQDIYAQRIDKNGIVKWTQNGKAISSTIEYQYLPELVEDGNGGAFILWKEMQAGNQTNDLYAQRIDSNGNTQWNAAGVLICNAPDVQLNYDLIADGNGGAIFTWQDDRQGYGNSDIYAQRVNAAGVTQWGNNGKVICNLSGNQQFPHLCTDGNGGAFITWQDKRTDLNIYAQLVNSAGVIQWTPNGDTICTAFQVQTYPNIVSDNNGGAIIAWTDYRNNTDYKVYAQRVNAAGTKQWAYNGILISGKLSFQEYLEMIPDGAGGAIVAWDDDNNDITIQRVSASGTPIYTAEGTAVSTATDDQFFPRMVSDNSGGAIVTWMDYRAGADIYAQHINPAGTGLESINEEDPIIVYPNPANSSCTIWVAQDFEYRIIDFSGRLVQSGFGKKDGHLLDVSLLNDGIYLIKVQMNNHAYLRKLILSKASN
jgi:hypothetical protein